MPNKKNVPMPKNAEKRNVAEAPQESANGQIARTAKAGKAGPPARDVKPSQMESFEDGMRLFHARQFREARELFLLAAHAGDSAVAHRAGLHARMCEQRLEAAGPVLNTSEERYNYAITLMNSRDLAGAQKHLRAVLDADPSADHALYALAACQCLGGDWHSAYENLKRAIDLQPRNRLAARQDPDFTAVADNPTFARLLNPDKKS